MEQEYIGVTQVKIFSETNKWNDLWFRNLTPVEKLIYLYVCDRCDHAGIWEFDPDMLILHTKIDFINEDSWLEAFSPKIEKLPNGKWWIKNYITFQNPKGISRKFKHCNPIYASLEKNGIDPEQFSQSALNLETDNKETSDYDVECKTVMDLWNTKCGGQLSQITKITPSRARCIKAATKEKVSFFDLFNKVLESDFLMGREVKWKASFDWVIKPSNRIKIMEGTYGASENRRSHSAEEYKQGF